MAKSGFLAFVDDRLEELFNRHPRDPTKDRKRALEHLDKCEEQFRTPPEKGRKFVVTRGDTTKFAPRYRFHGRDAHYIPTERFPDALRTLRSEVSAGTHDDAIAAGKGAQRGSGGSGGGKGWSPARRAAFRATMAAKKGK